MKIGERECRRIAKLCDVGVRQNGCQQIAQNSFRGRFGRVADDVCEALGLRLPISRPSTYEVQHHRILI